MNERNLGPMVVNEVEADSSTRMFGGDATRVLVTMSAPYAGELRFSCFVEDAPKVNDRFMVTVTPIVGEED